MAFSIEDLNAEGDARELRDAWTDAVAAIERGNPKPMAAMLEAPDKPIPDDVREVLAKVCLGTLKKRDGRPQALLPSQVRQIQQAWRLRASLKRAVSSAKSIAEMAKESGNSVQHVKAHLRQMRSQFCQDYAAAYGCSTETIKNAIRGL